MGERVENTIIPSAARGKMTAMTDPILAIPLTRAARVDQIFPTLTPAQIARIAAHGRVRQVQRGEVLLEVGDVRGGSVKRVASAVGERSIAVASVHQALRE